MNLLAIDSCSKTLSVSIGKKEEIFSSVIQNTLSHSENLMRAIDELMKKASLKPPDLGGVLCMGGPGSFTGLRIAFSAAKGLAMSLSIPFAAVPTFDCIAFAHKEKEILLAVIESTRSSFYYSFFRKGERQNADLDGQAEHIFNKIESFSDSEKKGAKIFLAGHGAVSLFSIMPQALKAGIEADLWTQGFSKELIAIAKFKNLLDNLNIETLNSGPSYIRAADAEKLNEKNGRKHDF